MARTIVLLALLVVLVTCQSQNPGCDSIDMINIPLMGDNNYQTRLVNTVLQTPNARVATWYFDGDASVYRFTPWVTSSSSVTYSGTETNAAMLDAAREHFAVNSTATRKIVLIGAGYINEISYYFGEDYSTFIAAARRLKQSGVEVHVINNNDYTYKSFWDQVASTDSVYTDNCPGCNYINNRFHPAIRGLTGMNSTGCSILGANPRVSTFDGNNYVFNGLGDYWFVRSSQNSIDSSQFGIQVRMAPCDNSNPSSGSCVRAVAIRTTNNNIISFFIDPATGLLSVVENGDIRTRDFYGVGGNTDGYQWDSQPISVPGTDEIGYSISIRYQNINDNRRFTFVLGDKMGVTATAVLGDSDFGSVSGLCGTFDGCMNNDYYAADQTYINPGDSAENIFTYFSETWRVQQYESFVAEGDADFDQNIWYYQNYPEYAKNWTPRMDSLEVTSDSAEACKFFSEKSEYLYQVCTDSVSMSVPQYAAVAVGIYMDACQTWCDYGPEYGFVQYAFIDDNECQAYCDEAYLYYNWDFHAVYNATNLPPYSVDLQNTYAATTQFALGGTYTVAYTSDYCDTEAANATVTITCDESPVVDAGEDRSISRTVYGWPAVYLIGSATDVNEGNLQFSWKVIEAPMARNTTGYDGYKNPQGYNSPNAVDMYWTNTRYAIMWPIYPGTYVVELAVYDGCSISYDTVTINATCDNCALTVTAVPAEPYYETTDSHDYSNVNLGSTAWNYLFGEYSDMNLAWALESTSTGLKLVKKDDSKVYTLNTVYTDNVLNTTVDITNNTNTNTVGPYNGMITDNAFINRYEGVYEMTVETETLDIITTTTVLLSSVDMEVETCQVNLYNPYSLTSTFGLINNEAYPAFYPTAPCNGDYNFRVDYSDQCFDAEDRTTVTHRCAKSPVAQLIACDPNWKFDYDAVAWPDNHITLDARDSIGGSSTSTGLNYLFTALSQPAWDTRDTEILVGGLNQATWFTPGNEMTTQTGVWDFQVAVRDDCSFSISEKATVHLSCDDQTPLLYSSVTTIKSSNGTAGWNTFTLDSSASSNPHDTLSGYRFDLISGDITGVTPNNFPINSALTTFALNKAGTYTFVARTFDGCWWKNSSTVTVTYTCDATITPSVAITPSASAAYDTNTNTWPTFNLDGAASTVNVNRMAYNWDVTLPSGDTYFGVSTSNALTINTGNPFFREVGAYVATFTLTDGCRTVVQNYTVTVTCPALATVTLGVAGATVTNGSNAADVHFYTTPETTGIWTIYDAQGNSVVNTFGANATLTSTTVQTYTAVFSYGNGCQSRSLNRTFAATCQWNPTFPLTTSTVTWTHNKFPRFALAPTVTGQNPDVPAYGYLNYVYRVLSAPAKSIWAPMNSTITYSNITSNVTVPQFQSGGLWYRVSYQTVTTETVTTTKEVTLVNGNEWFEGCFAADLPGDYSVQLSVVGYCSEYIVSTVTVSARCNTAPVATATYTQEVATGYYVNTPIVLDALASTDVDGDNLTYFWEVVSVPANSPYMLNDSTTQNVIQNRFLGRTQFAVAASGTYGLRLTVSDGCSNTTTDLSVVISCNNNLAISNPQQSHEFDGFTPVSMSQFTFVATDRCDLTQYWDVVAFTPAEKVTPQPQPEPTSGASQVAMSLFALFALIALLL